MFEATSLDFFPSRRISIFALSVKTCEGKFRKDLQSFSISRHTDDNLAALVSYAGITIKTQLSHAYYHLTRLNFTDEIIHIFT